MLKVVELSPTKHYTLSMKRGDRYIGLIEGQRYWKGLDCGHPVPNYSTRRCMNCWNLDRSKTMTGIKKSFTVKGEKHHSWKGGRVINTGGYIDIRVDGRYLLEHRLIMEKHLGRKLVKGEEVHHINHNKQDNRLDNLMLFSNHAEHIAYEHKNGERAKK